MKKKGISVEVIPTDKAISTYNFLVEEGRLVSAALIPPDYVHQNADVSIFVCEKQLLVI